jgi:DNA-binding CsgD family transcriptional regulator
MGRPRSNIETEEMLDLLEQGFSQTEVADELGVSAPTLAKKIADIQSKQGLILKYRALQSIQLTELQCRVLEAITPEKINEAPLKDLVGAYKILKDKELVVDGKPTEIKGLVAYLVEMERRNLALESDEDTPIDITEQSGGNGKSRVNGARLTLGDFNTEDLNLQSDEEYLN